MTGVGGISTFKSAPPSFLFVWFFTRTANKTVCLCGVSLVPHRQPLCPACRLVRRHAFLRGRSPVCPGLQPRCEVLQPRVGPNCGVTRAPDARPHRPRHGPMTCIGRLASCVGDSYSVIFTSHRVVADFYSRLWPGTAFGVLPGRKARAFDLANGLRVLPRQPWLRGRRLVL